MGTFIRVNSAKFPILPGEADELVNEGMYGKALAEYLISRLREYGYDAPFCCCEDWGWWVELAGFPCTFGSALSFFSDEAFRFYLPAYLIADIDGLLEKHSPVFHLTHSFTNEQKDKKLNPKRYGERTWFESARHKFSVFNKEQVSSIISYLKFKKERDAFGANEIGEALKNYWFERSAIADLVGCVNEM